MGCPNQLPRTQVTAKHSRSRSGPVIPEIGVLGLVSNPWSNPWMPRNHVLTRLGRYFNVVWFDPAREWREWWLGRSVPPQQYVEPTFIPDGFQVYRPGRWLPRFHKPRVLADFTESVRFLGFCPVPLQPGHLSLTIFPWPRHAGHAVTIRNIPPNPA